MSAIKLLDGEYQIPVLSPDDVPVFYLELSELALVKVLIVLRVRILTNKIADIDHLRGIVAERQAHRKIADICCIGDE